MSKCWEYMAVNWVYTREWTLPADGSPGKAIWRSKLHIYRSGQEAEIRDCYDSEEPVAKAAWWLDVLQELGAEGWELVGETVQDTVLVSEENGWKSKGTPANVRWLLKRRLERDRSR
jgi:hypothetical protein